MTHQRPQVPNDIGASARRSPGAVTTIKRPLITSATLQELALLPALELHLFNTTNRSLYSNCINKKSTKGTTDSFVNMASNPLSPQSILQAMADALPTHAQDDSSSDMSSSAEAIALFTHACMVKLGFRLLGFHEDEKMGKASPIFGSLFLVPDPKVNASSPESECNSIAPRLPAKWNAHVSSYSFLYAHHQSSMKFVLKTDRLGPKVEIRGLAVGADRINRFELAPRDYVSNSALPLRITLRDGAEDRVDLPQKLQAVFVSPERIADLATLVKINIIQRLIPSLQKEGYEEGDPAARDDDHRRGEPYNPPRPPPPAMPEPARPYPFDDPLAAPPRRPGAAGDEFVPPGFEDELEINRPPRGGALRMPGGRSPFNIGHDDLHPPGLGPHDPLRGSFVPGGGLPRPGGMGGGMHPTFDDPLFGGRGGDGGEGYDPQAPPGARWDPVGPGGPRGPRFGGQGPGGNPFGGDII